MKSQRGNIIIFLLIGLILFGSISGGLWWLKNRASDVAEGPATTAEQSADGEQAGRVGTNTDNPEATEATESAPDENREQAPVTGDTDSSISVSGPSSVASSGPTEDRLLMASGLGVLTFATTSYLRSRRSL